MEPNVWHPCADLIVGDYYDVYHQIGGWVRTVWAGEFSFSGGQWHFTYLAEGDLTSDIVGHGDTPREALDSCAIRWTLLNGGVESPALRHILPRLRAQFEEDGYPIIIGEKSTDDQIRGLKAVADA